MLKNIKNNIGKIMNIFEIMLIFIVTFSGILTLAYMIYPFLESIDENTKWRYVITDHQYRLQYKMFGFWMDYSEYWYSSISVCNDVIDERLRKNKEAKKKKHVKIIERK